MTLHIAFQIDPIFNLNIAGDTSFALALEAQRRGFHIATYQPQSLFVQDGEIWTKAQKTKFKDVVGDHAHLELIQNKKLCDYDCIIMRQDPPFDMQYITATYLLELASKDVLIVNNPATVRSTPEKILPLYFQHLMPPTLITNALEEINQFRETHKEIILKPLYGNGGKGVILITERDVNYVAIAEMMLAAAPLPIIAQKFLKNVRHGDKRIIFIDGEPVAVLNRIPAKGEIRANIGAGASSHLDSLTAEDKNICDTLSPYLRENGIILAGIDVIAERLTEINITSPTGLRQVKALGGLDISKLFWDVVANKIDQLHKAKT